MEKNKSFVDFWSISMHEDKFYIRYDYEILKKYNNKQNIYFNLLKEEAYLHTI